MILKKQEAMGPHFSGKLPKQEKSRVVPVEQGMIPIAEEISISYLIIQHKKELLDSRKSLKAVIKETLDSEFLKMLESCLFVPFLQDEMLKTCVVPKSASGDMDDKYSYVPNVDDANFLI